MAEQEINFNRPTIPEPLMTEADGLVENIFPIPGTDKQPDFESQDLMGEYLISRFEPEEQPKTRVVLTESGRTMPVIERVPAGYKEKVVTRYRKVNPKEWFVSPRQALAVALGSLVLFNVGDVTQAIKGSEYVGHKIYRLFDPLGSKTVIEHESLPKKGKIHDISMLADTSDLAGSTTIENSVIEAFLQRVNTARAEGDKVLEVKIRGNTSDEWSNEASIGVKSEDNKLLGEARASAAFQALSADDFKIDSTKVVESQEEHVIDSTTKASLQKEAEADGYPNIKAAIDAVDSQQNVPLSLAQRIKNLFTSEKDRGVALDAIVENPAKVNNVIETFKKVIKGKDHSPKVPSPHFYGFIPLIPFRRRKKQTEYSVKELSRWQFTPSKPIMKPQILREQKDQVWIRLRPESVGEDTTLKENPWAYSRKFEDLFREDNRVRDMLRADFKDPAGKDKSLRVMFVDHTPDEITTTAFSNLLEKLAAMEDGKIADRVSAIFVFPSEHAGTLHNDHKNIALGIDKQSQAGILGTYTAALDLVELHMPTTWESEDLQSIFNDIESPIWVAAHELAGHGTDETDEPLKIRRVLARGIPQAHVIDGEHRANKMNAVSSIIKKLPTNHLTKSKPVEFDITYPVQDNTGQLVTMSARVRENDPRLTHATTSTIVGHRPTQYSNSSDGEHYAETAASVTTGIVVPFNEASVSVASLTADNGRVAVFSRGYRPEDRGQEVFTESVGANLGSFPVEFESMPKVQFSHMKPEDDPVIRREIIRVRSQSTLHPDDMIAILARVIGRRRTF